MVQKTSQIVKREVCWLSFPVLMSCWRSCLFLAWELLSLCCSRKKKEGKSCSGEARIKGGAASWEERRVGDEECYSDVEERAKKGEEENRELEADGYRWTRHRLHGSHSHLCGNSAGLRRPLSCAWSRSLAGGRGGGGWQTGGGRRTTRRRGKEMRGRNFEMFVMTLVKLVKFIIRK